MKERTPTATATAARTKVGKNQSLRGLVLTKSHQLTRFGADYSEETPEGRCGRFQKDGQPGPHWAWGLLSAGWRTRAVDVAKATMGVKKGCPRARCCPPTWTQISMVILVFLQSFLVFLTGSSPSGLGHPLPSCLCCGCEQLLCWREGGLSSSPLRTHLLHAT